MTSPKERAERFEGDFKCAQCGSLITLMTFLAVIDGPGAEIHCRHCRQGYIITREGAMPITDDDLNKDFIDASGQRFRLPEVGDNADPDSTR